MLQKVDKKSIITSENIQKESFEGNIVSYEFFKDDGYFALGVSILMESGYGVVDVGHEQRLLKEGDWLNLVTKEDILNLTIMAKGDFSIHKNCLSMKEYIDFKEDYFAKAKEESFTSASPFEEAGFFEKSKEKRKMEELLKEAKKNQPSPKMEDFKESFIIHSTNFRMANIIFRNMKNFHRDLLLRYAITKFDNSYVDFLVFFGGIMVSSYLFLSLDVLSYLWIGILGWIIVYFFILGPLLMMWFLPRPIKNHIKDKRNMTEAELQAIENEELENERIANILSKYKISGRNIPRD